MTLDELTREVVTLRDQVAELTKAVRELGKFLRQEAALRSDIAGVQGTLETLRHSCPALSTSPQNGGCSG